MKYFYGAGALYRLFLSFWREPEGFIALIIWIIVTAIETAIISAVIALIGKALFDKEFEDVFGPSFIIVGIIEVILGLFSLCS